MKLLDLRFCPYPGSGNLVIDTVTLAPPDPGVAIVPLRAPGVIRVPFTDINFDPNQPDLIGLACQATSNKSPPD